MEGATLLFVKYMKDKQKIIVDKPELIWEGITLYHEEIDPNLFPVEDIKTLPDPLLLLTTSYVDKEEQEWIFCIAAEVDNAYRWLYALCLKNGELIDKHISLQVNE